MNQSLFPDINTTLLPQFHLQPQPLIPVFNFDASFDFDAALNSLAELGGAGVSNLRESHTVPADPRFPYANLLHPGPLDAREPYGASMAPAPANDGNNNNGYGAHQYYLDTDLVPGGTKGPDQLGIDTDLVAGGSRGVDQRGHNGIPHLHQPPPRRPAPAQQSRSAHRAHPYNHNPYHPTQADILARHSNARSAWDVVSSPDQDFSASAPGSGAGTPTGAAGVASGSALGAGAAGGEAGAGGSRPAATGRSGQKRRQKYTRTRTGCLCCRTRRIKCDEARPVCKRCVIAKKDCVYPDNGPGSGAGSGEGGGKEEAGKGGKGKGKSSGEESESEEDRRLSRRGSPHHGNQMGLAHHAHPLGLDYAWDQSYVNPAHQSHTNSPYDGSALPMGNDALVGTGMGGGMGLMEMGMNMGVLQGQAGSGAGGAAGAGNGWNMADFGKQDWGAEQGGAPMLSTPNFLLPWFPTAEERSLILHYCANAASLMMAIPSGLNPMLAINLPLALDSPRGMNPSADALRVALLGIGAIHQAFLLARSGVSSTQTSAMFQYASTLRDTGKEMVRRAAQTGATDAALGAGTALATIDIFFGGAGWMENFSLAKEMVRMRGGPAEMLKNSTPTTLTEGVTVSPARLMLEILAIYETFGCLPTGQEPTLISDQWDSWWLEASRSTYEEHSVEKQFGMSRAMVLLFARLTRLVSRVAKTNAIISESDSAAPVTATTASADGYPPLLSSLIPTPSSTPGPTPTSAAAAASANGHLGGVNGYTEESLGKEARQLNKDVDAWIESLQLSTLEHERVQVGNRAYAHAMKILLLRMVFKYPREDARVQSAAQQVLQHCSWSTAALGMSIDLTWPAIIGGSCVDGSSRQWLLTLMEGFKSQCCFDIDTATRIITEVWRRVDARESRADWKDVCDDLGLHVL
ncbi:hypothetical protein IAT38_000099 [Cryptococcus sp. DSM 104549]